MRWWTRSCAWLTRCRRDERSIPLGAHVVPVDWTFPCSGVLEYRRTGSAPHSEVRTGSCHRQPHRLARRPHRARGDSPTFSFPHQGSDDEGAFGSRSSSCRADLCRRIGARSVEQSDGRAATRRCRGSVPGRPSGCGPRSRDLRWRRMACGALWRRDRAHSDRGNEANRGVSESLAAAQTAYGGGLWGGASS